jgi:hypothetical protein
MGSQPHRLATLSFVVSMLAIGLECASAEECDYKTCGALMARDASTSWAVSGQHDYSPDTKQACAKFNACVRRAKNNSAGRAAAAPAANPSSLKSSSTDSTTNLKPEPANQQATQPHTADSSSTIASILRASCGPDMQKFCAGARRESDVLKCLDSQRMALSTTCNLYFQKLGARPTAQRNSPNKKPPSPPPTTPVPAEVNASNKQPQSPPPTAPVPAEVNGSNKQPQSPPPTAPIPAEVNASNKQPQSPPTTTPTATQENSTNKPPTTKTIPFPD